jgi:hypothetical protein
MDATKGNGLDAANDQPAKTLTKRTTDFIAYCTVRVLTDVRVVLLLWAAGQVLILAGLGVFQ